jgi:hypothetical protein
MLKGVRVQLLTKMMLRKLLGLAGIGGLSGSGFGGTGASNYDADPAGLNDATGYGHGGTGGPVNRAAGDGAGGLIWVEEFK